MRAQEIEIRAAEPSDYAAFQAILSQPKAVWGTLQLPFLSQAAWRKRLEEQSDSLHSLVACVDGEVVGNLGLSVASRSPRRRHAGEIGMVVHDKWQGRGVGSVLIGAAIDLADNWLSLSRLELTVFIDNEPAIKLYKRTGFEIEGRLRQYAFRNGEFVDAYAMGRLGYRRRDSSD